MRRMQRGMSVVGLVLAILSIVTPVHGGRWAEEADPWGQVLYDNDGRILAATGQEEGGIPLALSVSSEIRGDQATTRISYQRGASTLSIRRTFEGSTGMDSIYETDGERLVISLAVDELTGETLVVYRLPTGDVYSLWMAGDGEVLSGDIRGLRRALREPMEITRLLKSYIRQKGPFSGELPSANEMFLLPMVSCEDACAAGCDLQCAWECAFLGPPGCQTCKTACALGCAIGCAGS